MGGCKSIHTQKGEAQATAHTPRARKNSSGRGGWTVEMPKVKALPLGKKGVGALGKSLGNGPVKAHKVLAKPNSGGSSSKQQKKEQKQKQKESAKVGKAFDAQLSALRERTMYSSRQREERQAIVFAPSILACTGGGGGSTTHAVDQLFDEQKQQQQQQQQRGGSSDNSKRSKNVFALLEEEDEDEIGSTHAPAFVLRPSLFSFGASAATADDDDDDL